MNVDITVLLPYLKEYGYIALYLILWIGFFGFPAPNEVIVMTSGFIANKSVLQPLMTFIVTYLGVISSLTTLFFLGRFENKLVSTRKKAHTPKLQKAKAMIEKYGAFSLIISYYFPTARHLIPLLLGANKFPFKLFSLISYTNAFIWTLLFFFLGYEFGAYIDVIGSIVYRFGWYGLAIIILIGLGIYYKKSTSTKQLTQKNNQ